MKNVKHAEMLDEAMKHDKIGEGGLPTKKCGQTFVTEDVPKNLLIAHLGVDAINKQLHVFKCKNLPPPMLGFRTASKNLLLGRA